MKTSNHIEALLFLAGEPVKIKKLAEILDKKEEEIKEGLKDLEEDLKNRGLVLVRKNGEIILGTSPECSECCEKLAKEELNKNIGRAGLETLAIILYKEKVSKPEIDYLRGVNSDYTIRNLMIRGLVERGVNPKNKRSYVYSPSIFLFQHLGISKKEELPQFEEFVKNINDAIE